MNLFHFVFSFNKTDLLTSKNDCTRFREIYASIRPFIIQGNAFRGAINLFNSAKLANVVATVIGVANRAAVPNVSKFMMTGVVAQKYTQNASKYFCLDSAFTSRFRASTK